MKTFIHLSLESLASLIALNSNFLRKKIKYNYKRKESILKTFEMKAICLFILCFALANAAFDHIAYSTAYSNQLRLSAAAVDHGLLCFQSVEPILNNYRTTFFNTIKSVPVSVSSSFLNDVDAALKSNCPGYKNDIDAIVSQQAPSSSKTAISNNLNTYNTYFQELLYEWADDFNRGDYAKAGQDHAYLFQAALAILDAGKAPVASFSIDSIVGFSTKVDASTSSATFGATIAGYSWTFGEPTSTTNTATGKIATHTYAGLGTYVVRLAVTDNRGKKSVLTKTIVITNIPPTAEFKQPAVSNLKVTVDCLASQDQDGTVLTNQCAWDFGEVTSSSNKATGVTAEHSYANPGTYTITLNVVDDKDASATFSKSVTVTSAKPTADFKPPAIKYLNLDFDGSLSKDLDGTIKKYTWSFGDGTTATDSIPTVSHTYSKPGTYQVKLEVTDNHGETGTKSQPITVDTAYPQASFVVDPHTDLRIKGTAAQSSDLDGPIVKYIWNFGDLTGDIVSGPTFVHVYVDPGTYDVKLTVEDEYGAKGTTSQKVTVINGLPTASFSVTQKDYHQIDLDGSTSSDPYGVIKVFIWNFGDGTGDFTVSGSPIISHTYTTPNTYTVTLTVKDNHGATGTTSQIIKIETDPLIVDLNKQTKSLGELIHSNSQTSGQQDQAQDGEITRLTNENIAQDTKDDELVKKNESQDTLITELTNENIAQDTKDGELVKKNEVQDLEITRLTDENKAQDIIHGDLAQKNQEQDGKIKAVEDENKDQDNRLDTLQIDNLEQDSQIRAVEGANTQEDTDIKALKEHDPVQDNRIKAIEDQNIIQDTNIKAVQDYNENQDTDIEALKKENVALKASLRYKSKRQYFGKTTSDDWEAYTSGTTSGLRTYVDLSHLNLKNVPHVTVSLEGDSNIWMVTGGSDVYTLNNKGFSVFIRYDNGVLANGQPVTLEVAKEYDWHLDYTVTSTPVARFDATASNLVVNFDGSKSSDEDGPLTVSTWDFGDNTGIFTGIAPSHTYSADGTYKVTLTVEDKLGVVNRLTKKISVVDLSPIANFDWTSSFNTIKFNGLLSQPRGGRTIVDWSWNFGESASSTNTATGNNPTHEYAASGTYQVKLTVKDSAGDSSSITIPVTVTEVSRKLFWDIENVQNNGPISTAVGTSDSTSITAQISQTAGGPAENFSSWNPAKWVFLTRWFGQNYPYIKLTTSTMVKLDSLSFKHLHNHSQGDPTWSYQVGVQLSTNLNSGYSYIGNTFIADSATHQTIANMALGGQILQPGTYYIRWIPTVLASTGNGYFAIDDITLNLKV